MFTFHTCDLTLMSGRWPDAGRGTVRFNICKRDWRSWHPPLCLWRPKQVIQAKTLSFSNPNQAGFLPRPSQNQSTGLSRDETIKLKLNKREVATHSNARFHFIHCGGQTHQNKVKEDFNVAGAVSEREHDTALALSAPPLWQTEAGVPPPSLLLSAFRSHKSASTRTQGTHKLSVSPTNTLMHERRHTAPWPCTRMDL